MVAESIVKCRSRPCIEIVANTAAPKTLFLFSKHIPALQPAFTATRSDSDQTLVQIKAQVMIREESTGGWVPLGGGGMSSVALVKKIAIMDTSSQPEYVIVGQRIADQTVVLTCRLQKDLQYTIANPTFHHWLTEDRRFGLTFQNSNDAQLFESAIQEAFKMLSELSHEAQDPKTFFLQNIMEDREDDRGRGEKDIPASSFSGTVPSTSQVSPSELLPSSVLEESGGSVSGGRPPHPYDIHCVSGPTTAAASFPPHTPSHRSPVSRHYTSPTQPALPQHEGTILQAERQRVKGFEELEFIEKEQSGEHLKLGSLASDVSKKPEYYVDIEGRPTPEIHEYQYPTVEMEPLTTEWCCESQTGPAGHQVQTLTPGSRHKASQKSMHSPESELIEQAMVRVRCTYCQGLFDPDDNPKGRCPDAPDRVTECIDRVSCICCAQGVLYHCIQADADGHFGHPCACNCQSNVMDESPCKKWVFVTLLSFVAPCLICYWPLTLCHRGCMMCGWCGGRHRAE